ncbi:MAG: carboxypeptidase-like regulatory domain-containing protein [Chitinophagaceae bacterium]
MFAKLTFLRLLTLLLLFFTSSVIAQKTVSGKVTNAANQPLAGASVEVKGTNIGTTTDDEGRFTINVPKNQGTLVVTSVGYAGSEVAIGERSSVDFSLKESTSSLNEIVVTGYASQAKKDITGSVAVVTTEAIPVSRPVYDIKRSVTPI